MANIPADVLRIVDTLANVQANMRSKQIAFETTNNRIVVKDAGGSFHYFKTAGDTDIIIDDNTAGAFRVREDVNDYHNIDTTDGTEIMSFGNVSISPEYRYLGTGKFGIGVTPAQKFEIGSNDNTDRLSIFGNNSSFFIYWDDGFLEFESSEGTNANTDVYISGHGTGHGNLLIWDGATSNFTRFRQNSGIMSITNSDTGAIEIIASNNVIKLQSSGENDVKLFQSSAEGVTKSLTITGHQTSGTVDTLEIAVGEHIDQAASFFGCAGGYYFDNKVIFTQVDGNEYIDSEADGYMDYHTTTEHQFSVDATSNVVTIGSSVVNLNRRAEFLWDRVLLSGGETDLGTGAVDWATADAAQDGVGQKNRVDVGATAGNNYYSLSGLVDGQLLCIYNTGSATAYVGAAGSGSENMAISMGACGFCIYVSATTDLYAAT